MTQITPKLGLLLYDIGVPDNQASFLQFRTDMAGISGSNFVKIDDAVADIDDRLSAIEDLKPIIKIEGTTTDNANYVAISPSITDVYDGLIIDFIPNQDNNGTATLTINNTYIHTINKIDSSGQVVELEARDLISLRRYFLEYNGTEWILVNSTSADQVNVNGTPSSILVVDVDNSIAASSISVVDNKISGDNIKTDPASIVSDAGALSLTETLSVPGIYKGIEWDATGRAINVETNKVLPTDIEIDNSLRDNGGALGLNLSGITAGTYKGTTFDATGRATASAGKVQATEINHSTRFAETSGILDLTKTGIEAGTYKGLTLDIYGRVIGTNNLIQANEISINNSLKNEGGVLGVSVAPDSDKLDGIDSTGFVNTDYDQAISGTKYFNAVPVVNADPTLATHVVRKSYADASYLGVSAKAADSDKLDGVDSAGFVQTSGDQTISGVKTFNSLPLLSGDTPTSVSHAIRKGYADATYLRITAKAADSDKLDGVDITAFKGLDGLGDPLRDRLLFWDDSAKALMWLDAGTGLTIDGTTITSSPARYFVKAYRSTAFSIASGSVTTIPLNAEEFDTHAQHDNTTNPSRLTCKKAGIYLVNGTITFNATANSSWNMSIRKNNTTDIVREATIASSGGVYVTATVLVPLAENDYVEMQGWHGLGSSVDLIVTNNYNVQLSMARISD